MYGKDEQENKEITDEKNGAPPLLRINAGFEMDVELNCNEIKERKPLLIYLK